MSDFAPQQEAGFWAMRLMDLPLFVMLAVFILVVSLRFRPPPAVQLMLYLHAALPFFLNGLLFPVSYMPDQLKYLSAFYEIRTGALSVWEVILHGGNVDRASLLFAAMPLPFALTPNSLGFYNGFIWTALFLWLYRKGVFTHLSMWFYLLYPSMALYSSLSLRDTFVFAFMIMAAQWAREGRWVIMLVPLVLLYAIKFQNFYILAPVLFLFLAFGIRHKGLSISRGAATLVTGVAALVALSPIALPLINYFRRAMYVEDGGDADQVQMIEGPVQFVLEGMTSGIYFLMKPFPWDASNLLQIIQSFENLAIAGLLVLLARAAWNRAPRMLIFWTLFLIFAASIYGLVVFNYGTAARYRFPFLTFFVIFVCADCRAHSLFKNMVPPAFQAAYLKRRNAPTTTPQSP